jgi:hypothetical protein
LCAEIILNQGNLRGVGKPTIRHVLQKVGVAHRRVAIRDGDVPPAFKGRKQHEDIRGSVAFVLVINPRGRPGLAGIGTRVSLISRPDRPADTPGREGDGILPERLS